MGSLSLPLDEKADANGRDGWANRRAAISRRLELTALELLVERGVANVTVDDIAAAANISRSKFYRYFDAIEDVMCAMPRRALERLAENFLERPLDEGIVTAYANAARVQQYSEDEARILQLSMLIYSNEPESWWRATARMRPSSRDMHKTIVAERMRLCGEDPSGAHYIGVVLDAIMDEVARTMWSAGASSFASETLQDAIELAVRGLKR